MGGWVHGRQLVGKVNEGTKQMISGTGDYIIYGCFGSIADLHFSLTDVILVMSAIGHKQTLNKYNIYRSKSLKQTFNVQAKLCAYELHRRSSSHQLKRLFTDLT